MKKILLRLLSKNFVVVALLIAALALLAFMVRRPMKTEPAYVFHPCPSDCTVVNATSIRTIKAGITFEFPKPYVKHFDQSHWDPEPNGFETVLNVKWPSMSAFTMDEIDALFKEWDKTGRSPETGGFLGDLLEIRIRDHKQKPVPISADELEAVIVSRYGTPRKIEAIPNFQEYGENPRELAYRTIVGSSRFADGMPAYIFCRGKKLVASPVVLSGGCVAQLTWPNGFEIDLKFNRADLPQWQKLHDSALALVQSFIVEGALPKETLLSPVNVPNQSSSVTKPNQ